MPLTKPKIPTYTLLLALTRLLSAQQLNPPPVPLSPAPAVAPAPPVPSEMKFPVSAPAPDTAEIEKDCCLFYTGTQSLPVVGTVRYEIWRRQPMDEIRFHENVFSASAYVWYEVDAGNFAQCGWDDEPARAVIAGLDSKVKWGSKWTLETSTQLRPLQPQNRCLLTHWNYDATDALARIAQKTIQGVAARFDQTIRAHSDYRQRANQMWTDLQQPKPVGDGQWMLLQPQSVAAGPITFGDRITSEFSVTIEPILVTSDQAPAVTIQPVPDIEVAPDPSGVHLITDLGVSFQQVTDLLNQPGERLVGQAFDHDRRELTIDNMLAYGSGPNIVLELSVHGKAIPGKISKIEDVVTFFENIYRHVQYAYERRHYKLDGKIYLTGSPLYSPNHQSLLITAIQYDAATRKAIAESKDARWILDTPLLGGVGSATEFPVGNRLDSLKAQILAQWNRQVDAFANLSGGVDSIAIRQTFIADQQLKVRLAIDGHIELNVQW